jgi:predicted NUDIX family NTP pyrophosphohydrolase
MYRGSAQALELLLVHPGGPFWAKKDLGAWSIPKGEYDQGEDPLTVARREFEEELGVSPPQSSFLPLGVLLQPSRKVITAFALPGDFDPATLKSNPFELE